MSQLSGRVGSETVYLTHVATTTLEDHGKQPVTNQVIPEAAVGAAAKAEYGNGDEYGTWETEPAEVREMYLNDARKVLEAAAPHMLAVVTTRAEQVNLPNGTVILSEQGGVFQHFNGYWFEPASSYRHHLDDVALPATVIHRPTP